MTRRETRFALVLNGGVSTASWMGGVVHELNRLRLASAGTDARPSGEAEAAVHDAWAEVLEKVERRAAVDAVAATSVGGLNGTVLANAIAAGRDLPDLRSLWSGLLALQPGKLLRPSDEPARSMLDGEFLHEQITRLLEHMAQRNRVTEPADCTLLVTAMALDPQPASIRLEGSARASLVDSRRVYRFERRSDDQGAVRDDFAACPDALALASRAAASLPIAVEPVWETNTLRRLREPSLGSPKSSWLVDAGSAHGSPFEHLLDTLRTRPVGAPFERVLLYVIPSQGPTPPSLGSEPTAAKVLGRALSAVREPDQRLDLEGLRRSFEQMGYARSTPEDAVYGLLCSSEPFMDASNALLAADQWFQRYRISRAEAVERWLMSLGCEVTFAEPLSVELPPRALLSVPRQLVYTSDEWRWGVDTARRALTWWGRALVRFSLATPAIDTTQAFEELETSLRAVARLSDALVEHMHARLDPTPKARVRWLNEFFRWGADDELRRVVESAAHAITALPLPDGMDAVNLINFTLGVEVVGSVLARNESFQGDAPPFRYRQVTPAIESIVDIGEVGGSPEWLSHKLYGERWGHLGAFASARGRESDWLWGRLDGAAALCDYLLEGVQDAGPLRRRLAQAILAAEGRTEEELKAHASEACRTGPLDMLRSMDDDERQVAASLLWQRAVGLVGEVEEDDPRRLGPVRAMRILGDPTWTKADLPSGATFRTRMVARVVRWYGAPARWFARRRARRSFGI